MECHGVLVECQRSVAVYCDMAMVTTILTTAHVAAITGEYLASCGMCNNYVWQNWR
jgi:hypothetical protein